MKKHTTYGYIVMPDGDTSSRADQMKALEEFSPDCILTDREYKTTTDRTSLEHILEMLKPKDVLVTVRLSNLGRSYTEILKCWNRIVEASAYIVTLEHPVIDTRPKKQEAEKTAAEFLILLTEIEKERSRKVIEGQVAAKRRGVRMGARRKEPPEDFPKYKEDWENKILSAKEAGKRLGISPNTFLRWVREC